VFTEDEDLNSDRLSRRPVGLKAQVGGGIAMFLGMLLFVFFPNVPPDAAINLHQMAQLFIVLGGFAFGFGTLVRAFGLD
jgi:hypothetical protein